MNKSSIATNTWYRNALVGNTGYIDPVYELIATASGTGASGTVSFTSIPADYTHLQIRYVARIDFATSSANLSLNFNSNSSNIYSWHGIFSESNSSFRADAANNGNTQRFPLPGTSISANSYAMNVMDITDYSSTSKYKVVKGFGGYWDGTSSYSQIGVKSAVWANTAAISSITMFTGSGNFTSASRFSLYGIRG